MTAVPAAPGIPPQRTTDAPTECPCNGTGAYTVEIPLADAIVSDERLCLEHGLVHRGALLDTTTGRVGELMEVNADRTRAWLRPIHGGREWDTSVGSLRPARHP